MLIMKASTPIPISSLRSVREPADTDMDGTKHRGTVTGPASCNSHRAALSTHPAKIPFAQLMASYSFIHLATRAIIMPAFWQGVLSPGLQTLSFPCCGWTQGPHARGAKEWSHNYDTDYKKASCVEL